jgi:hypothetical protein
VGVTPLFGRGALSELIELGERGSGPDLFERGKGQLFEGDTYFRGPLIEAQGAGLNFDLMIEEEDGGTLRGRWSRKGREIPALLEVGRIFDAGVADQATGMFGQDEIAGADANGAPDGFDGHTRPGMEGSLRSQSAPEPRHPRHGNNVVATRATSHQRSLPTARQHRNSIRQLSGAVR